MSDKIDKTDVNEQQEWDRLILLNKFAIEEVYTKLKILNEEFNHTNKMNPPIEHIKTRVKGKKKH